MAKKRKSMSGNVCGSCGMSGCGCSGSYKTFGVLFVLLGILLWARTFRLEVAVSMFFILLGITFFWSGGKL